MPWMSKLSFGPTGVQFQVNGPSRVRVAHGGTPGARHATRIGTP